MERVEYIWLQGGKQLSRNEKRGGGVKRSWGNKERGEFTEKDRKALARRE